MTYEGLVIGVYSSPEETEDILTKLGFDSNHKGSVIRRMHQNIPQIGAKVSPVGQYFNPAEHERIKAEILIEDFTNEGMASQRFSSLMRDVEGQFSEAVYRRQTARGVNTREAPGLLRVLVGNVA